MASVPRGNSAYASGPFRSREGLSSRSNPQSEQLQLRVDPIHGDLDEEIDGLHRKVSQLKNIAQEIESEARFQSGFLSKLKLKETWKQEKTTTRVYLKSFHVKLRSV